MRERLPIGNWDKETGNDQALIGFDVEGMIQKKQESSTISAMDK